MQFGREHDDRFKTVSKKITTKRDDASDWKTPAGTFTTNSKCKVQFTMPEFHKKTYRMGHACH